MNRKLLKRWLASALATTLLLGAVLPMGVTAAESEPEKTTITIAWPGAEQDASPNIQEAIEAAKKLDQPVVLEFEKDKIYHVFQETVYHAMNYYISNGATKEENPNGERFTPLFIKDMHDVTIEGNNALLMVHGVMTPILVDHSENIVFQNLHIDWARPTMSEMTVLTVGSNYARVKVNKDSLYELYNNKVRWLSEKDPDGKYYWTLVDGICVKYMPDQDRVHWESGFTWGNSIRDEGNNVLRLEYDSKPNLKVGDTYQFRSGSREQVGVFIHRSKDVRLDGMGLHYMHGLGIVGQYTDGISLHNVDCSPRKETGRTCASSADFMHFSGCKGLLSITDSYFRGAHDDVLNVHGTHLKVVAKDTEQNKVTVRFMERRTWGFQAFEVGDVIEFVNSTTMIPYAKNRVTDYKRLDDYQIELTLENPIPSDVRVNTDVVENVTWTPDVIMKGNKVYGIPTKGILCTTRGDVRIEDNYIYKSDWNGILLEDDANEWFESGCIRNMSIKGNTFVECGNPVISINPRTKVQDPEKTVHENISIVDNTFEGTAQIKAISTKNLLIDKNNFKDGGTVSLIACNGFAVTEDNAGLKDVSVNNSINDHSLEFFELGYVDYEETARDLDRSKMTISAVSNERDQGGNAAKNVLDGNPNTIWHSDWENVPAELSITIDLGGETTFNRLAYLPRQDGLLNGTIKIYEIYVKKAGSTRFTKVARGSWDATADEKYCSFEEVTATAVKLMAVDVVRDGENRRMASAAEIKLQAIENRTEKLAVGESRKLQLSLTGKTGVAAELPAGALQFKSSDEAVVAVSADGVITGKAEGSATVTVTAEAYGKTFTAEMLVNVVKSDFVPLTAVKINKDTLADGKFTATVTPAGAKSDLCWEVKSYSGDPATITQDGVLKPTGVGRMEVIVYQKNNPTIRDSVMILAKDPSASADWVIESENKDNWSVGDNGEFVLKAEGGVIWANLSNQVHNILHRPAGKDDFELVTKMHYKTDVNYAEAGIILYIDNDNYSMVSRKKHDGFGGNIFSMANEKNAKAEESPADFILPDTVKSDTVYLKLKKVGNSYSGYYSEDGTKWVAIWENRTVEFSKTPDIGVIAINDGTAVFDYLEVDGERITFSDLIPHCVLEEAKATEASRPTVINPITADREKYLPGTVGVVWNGSEKDAVCVEWQTDGYDADTIGTYTLTGTVEGIAEPITCTVHVVANKTALQNAVQSTEGKVESAYTAESWAAFKDALERANELLASTELTTTQESVDSCTEALVQATKALVSTGTSDIVWGDADDSGEVTTADARLILQYAAELKDESALNMIAADVVQDGEVTTSDARAILQYCAELIDTLPVKNQ